MTKATAKNTSAITPFLQSAKEMAKLSGIGENTLRQLMESGKIDYLQIGNRRMLTLGAVRDYYERNKTAAYA